MWDFALQYKPGFLYTPDVDEYEAEHPFGTDKKDWPYPLCHTNNELVEKIAAYNEEKNKRKIEKHFKITGSYEDGEATKKIIRDLIK